MCICALVNIGVLIWAFLNCLGYLWYTRLECVKPHVGCHRLSTAEYGPKFAWYVNLYHLTSWQKTSLCLFLPPPEYSAAVPGIPSSYAAILRLKSASSLYSSSAFNSRSRQRSSSPAFGSISAPSWQGAAQQYHSPTNLYHLSEAFKHDGMFSSLLGMLCWESREWRLWHFQSLFIIFKLFLQLSLNFNK